MGLSIYGLEGVLSSSFAAKARLGEKVHLSYLLLNCTSRLEDDGQLVREDKGFSEEEQQHIVEVFDELCPPPCIDVLEIEGFFGRWFPR
jgi:hypothetical protein